MRFIIGLATGIVLGIVGSTLTAGKSGQDLRQEFERIRSDIEKRNFDALGAHLEERFRDLQSGLEQRFSELKDTASSFTDDVEDAADDVQDAVSDAADELEKEAVPA